MGHREEQNINLNWIIGMMECQVYKIIKTGCPFIVVEAGIEDSLLKLEAQICSHRASTIELPASIRASSPLNVFFSN